MREAFIRLYDKGLIHRRKTLVNWSCFLESAISDIEIDNLDIKGPTEIFVPGYQKKVEFGQIYDIIYKTTTGEDIIVSTTRPETILGDVAIAVNPNDLRYSRFLQEKGIKVVHPFRKDTIPIIEDTSIDPEFGTGVVKITPGHDINDFLIAERHNLPIISMMNEKGSISEGFGVFSGIPRFTARNMILVMLKEKGFLSEIRPHKMILPICSRSQDIIELQLRPQWFVRCNEMSKKALEAVKSGKIKILPDLFCREWEHWLTNCRDWCISRQLWWGHQIPAWQSNNESSWVAAHTKDEALRKMKDNLGKIKQDEDVLDTWFSSALLPFSLHGWPKKSLNNFYPLNLIETGHDILFFWVARMVMLGLELTGKVPFNEILLHGIVCDAQGRKMSKSLGNIITPHQVVNGISLEKLQQETKLSFNSGIISKEELEKSIKGQHKMFRQGIPECGTDALRFTLCSHNIKSHFMNFDIQEVYTNRLFFNKIWQATRYTIAFSTKINLNLRSLETNLDELRTSKLSSMDHWIMSRLSLTSTIVKESLDTYKFHIATTALKNFFYANLCDTYLETTKRYQFNNSTKQGEICCRILATCLSHGLDLMEVFTPFLSNDLKTFLPQCNIGSLHKFRNPPLEIEVSQILGVCAAIRQQKSQQSITKRHKPALFLLPTNVVAERLLKTYQDDIETLTFSTNLTFVEEVDRFLSQYFTLQSTAGVLCTFGIITETHMECQDKTKKNNMKRLEKLEKDLQKIKNIVINKGYKDSASVETQIKHKTKVIIIHNISL